MKRFLSLLIVLLLVFTLSACSAELADRFTTYTATFTMSVDNGFGPDLSSTALTCWMRISTSTYAKIIESDTVLESVIEKTGVTLTTSQFREMLSFELIEDTDMLAVNVTSDDRQQAIDIAQAIAEVAPEFIEEVVEGLNVQVVDTPTVTENFSIGKLFR